ncbi:hypothetical protein WMY93_003022 [Mugilogobius chulae]|uniref:Ig-like domain-containing protein n=1 Tax=Mugilogobius chulae TaxID=88201 RepID=A0AAW0QAK1_9GOBI
MEPGPPPNWLMFVVGLLQWHCATVQTSFIIDNVGLSFLPSSTVESGTNVTIQCEVRILEDSSSELTAVDSGSYGCHVTVKEKSRSSLEKKLEVIGLQKPVLHLNKTVVFESEEVVASCSAPAEKGSLIFYFLQRIRSGEPQELKRAMSRGNTLETRLVLRQIGDSLLYCDYEIPLVGRSNHSNTVQVIVRGMSISPIMNILPSSEVYEGDVMEVVCKVVGTWNLDVDVFLIKGKRILRKARSSLSHRFRPQAGDSGELVCKAESGALQKETYKTIKVKDHKEVHRGKVYSTLAQANKNGNYTAKCKLRLPVGA